jgi:hypothetical protein
VVSIKKDGEELGIVEGRWGGGVVGNEMGIRGRTWYHCVCVIGLSESRGLGEDFGGSCNAREKHVDFWETNLCMKVEARKCGA